FTPPILFLARSPPVSHPRLLAKVPSSPGRLPSEDAGRNAVALAQPCRLRSRVRFFSCLLVSARNQHAGQPCRDRVGRPAGVARRRRDPRPAACQGRVPLPRRPEVVAQRHIHLRLHPRPPPPPALAAHHLARPWHQPRRRSLRLPASSGQKIRPLLRYASLGICMRFITCDGLLILWRGSDFYICNPATRKCAPLSHPPRQQFISPITGVDVLGLYRHQPSGEYRVLWVSYAAPMGTFAAVKVEQPHYLVFTVGSDQPRRIQWPTVSEDGCPAAHPPIHHRGSLHWAMGCSITVFETIAETFRQMSRPAQLGSYVLLLDTGDNLALYVSTDHDRVTLDVWVLQDYDAETWGFRYRINLLAMDASPPLKLWKSIPRLAVINERELLMAQPPRRLLHCDIDGVFLGNVESEEHENRLTLSWHRFQESMISVPLFEAQEEDAVSNEPPFVMVL
uniref:F-box associated beta-propeller type 3 domain-containing protein n=1 Tax=Aegilops tauschii subsp. strangulata TaxID=200361 RepID=A0A453QKE0_AEGTS